MMINREMVVFMGTAASIGLIHTLLGPDHYVPFIVMSRARRWSLAKTLLISSLSGMGHILSSVVLGFLGIALGITVARLEGVESWRGNLATWLLIGFGLAYFVWGLHRALRKKPHTHAHLHSDSSIDDHSHLHSDNDEHKHSHVHKDEHYHLHGHGQKPSITPWILFTIFVFGPCEPLIPLLMYPAAKHNLFGVVLVTLAFGLTTILTMLLLITLSSWGLTFLALGKLERYAHALAGAMILISGLSVRFLGL